MTINPITRLLTPVWSALILIIALTACQDPITLGTDLLEEDQVNVGFTDTLDVRARTLRGDTVLVYGPANNQRLDNYLFGDFEDPLFGKSLASIYTQVRLERTKPDFSDTVLDSVVLVLPYDTTQVYGKIEDETFSLEVRRLTEAMSNVELYFSNISFATDAAPIATFDFQPSLDSIEVVEYVSINVQDTVSYPHLRIPLSRNFGQELLGLDTTVTANDSTWLDYFPGLRVEPTRITPGLLSFDLNDPRSGIYLYYTQDDTVRRQFRFDVDAASARLSTYRHDYAGAPVEAFLDSYEAGDSLIFLQGMAGLITEIEILGLDQEALSDVIINKAELELTVKAAENDSLYPPLEQLVLFTRDEATGNLQVISDVFLSPNSGAGLRVFGGQYDEDSGLYAMNISAHLQEVIRNDGPYNLILAAFPRDPYTLFLSSFFIGEPPGRVALYGPGDPLRGIKLRLAYTQR